MAVTLEAHETLFLSMKLVETHFLPPSIPLKWRGLRGLEAPRQASPTQSIALKGAAPGDRGGLEALMAAHGILPVEAIDPLTRLSMACPALPLCGLAVTEAERYMPTMVRRVRGVLDHLGL